MTNEDVRLEREIGIVLARASRIAIPDGAQARLLARLSGRASANLLLFEPKKTRNISLRSRSWSIGAALAACFAIGIYLGASGSGDVFWPGVSDDDETIVGLGEPEDFFDGDAS
jgi:hypothetical protein